MKKNSVCLFCGAPSVLLCDGHLGYPTAAPKELHRAYNGMDLFRPYTCDAPMCEACALRAASYIVCRRGKGCIPDTVDYCPGCAAERANAEPNRRHIESDEHAARIRASHWRTWQKGERVALVDGGCQISLF